jgi:hypothetical protein
VSTKKTSLNTLFETELSLLLNLAFHNACVAFFKGEKKVIWNPRKG